MRKPMIVEKREVEKRDEKKLEEKKQEEREIDFSLLWGRFIDRCPECGRNGRLKILFNGDRKYTHKAIVEGNMLRITDYCHIKKV
jgi:hypothetical protein